MDVSACLNRMWKRLNDVTPAKDCMLILTTIYWTDLRDQDPKDAPEDTSSPEPGVDDSSKSLRELLSLYEGRNRVLPIDRSS
jgi:hypothetical protein